MVNKLNHDQRVFEVKNDKDLTFTYGILIVLLSSQECGAMPYFGRKIFQHQVYPEQV